MLLWNIQIYSRCMDKYAMGDHDIKVTRIAGPQQASNPAGNPIS